MELEAGKTDFQRILSNFSSDAEKEQFFSWIKREYIAGMQNWRAKYHLAS